MRKFKTALKGIESWEIHISPFGPVGYGAGGVYRLDQNLCPARKLIDAGVSNGSGRPRLVAHVADNAQTICIFVAEYSRKVLQIWTRDGKKMLREVDVGEPRRQTPSTRTLTAVGEGYLYTGIDLVWLSPAPEKAPWRFSASAAMKHKVSTAHNRHVSPFGPPLLHNNFLLVTCRDGGVYVFHLATVTK